MSSSMRRGNALHFSEEQAQPGLVPACCAPPQNWLPKGDTPAAAWAVGRRRRWMG